MNPASNQNETHPFSSQHELRDRITLNKSAKQVPDRTLFKTTTRDHERKGLLTIRSSPMHAGQHMTVQKVRLALFGTTRFVRCFKLGQRIRVS